jgi:hypothetical protein
MPIGYENFVGNDFVVYGGGTGAGANPPQVGTQISGTGQGFFSRIYDFSIQVDSVPEPSTLLLAFAGGGLLGGWCWLRRGQPARSADKLHAATRLTGGAP